MKKIELNKLVELSGGKTQSVKCGSVGLIWIGANLIGGVFNHIGILWQGYVGIINLINTEISSSVIS